MTNVSGYYNGAQWPIQLVISKLNVILHLQPGAFILDKKGRKINDPFFETFANNKQLQREISDKPVPVNGVPVQTAKTAPVSDGLSVRAVTEYTHDEKGVRHPVIPTPKEMPEQAANKAPIKAMTMEEARKAGLIKKIRDVPEDFGVTDTDGTPPRLTDVPRIKYAIDSSMNKKAPDLPPELLEMSEELQRSRSPLLAQLKKGASTNAQLDSEVGFMNAISTAPADSPITSGTPAPAAPPAPKPLPVQKATSEQETETIEEAETEQNAAEMIADAVPLPEPDLDAEESAPPLPTDEEAPPAPKEDAEVESEEAPAEKKTENRFVCCVCSADRRFRSQLKMHAESKHPDQVEAIMAPYPA